MMGITDQSRASAATWCVLSAALGACGGEPDSCPGDFPTRIEISTGGTPALVAYSTTGSWEAPDRLEPGLYSACVFHDYRVTAVCVAVDGTWSAEQYAATASDGDRLILPPCLTGIPTSEVVSVAGTVEGAGRLHLGGTTVASQSTSWAYDVSVAAGFHDLVVSNAYDLLDGLGMVAIRRGLDFRESSSVPTIDLQRDGVPTSGIPITLVGAANDDIISTHVYVTTDTSRIEVSATPSNVAHLLPPEVLASREQQLLSISAVGPPFSRGTSALYTGQTTLALIPRIDVIFDDRVATWSSLPDFSEVSFVVSEGRNSQRVRATRRWIDSHTSLNLHFDTSIDAYSEEWVVSVPRLRLFELTLRSGSSTSSSAFFQTTNP